MILPDDATPKPDGIFGKDRHPRRGPVDSAIVSGGSVGVADDRLACRLAYAQPSHARADRLGQKNSAGDRPVPKAGAIPSQHSACRAAIDSNLDSPELRTGLQDAARRPIASGDVETRKRLDEGLPTSGLAVIDFAGKDWRKLHPHGGRLERLVSPRSLAEASRA